MGNVDIVFIEILVVFLMKVRVGNNRRVCVLRRS